MTSLPNPIPDGPMGIIIRNGTPPRKPVVFWAYMWADDLDGPLHWHDALPRQAAA